MAMSLGIKTQTFGAPENQEWLASQHGTQSGDSILLDGTNLAALFPTGLVPSGMPLIKASGKYRAAITAEVPEYFLFTTVDLTAGGLLPAATDTPASGLWTAEIVAAKVPAYTGKTSAVAANTTVGLFKFV
jgi:hypothetical protein